TCLAQRNTPSTRLWPATGAIACVAHPGRKPFPQATWAALVCDPNLSVGLPGHVHRKAIARTVLRRAADGNCAGRLCCGSPRRLQFRWFWFLVRKPSRLELSPVV